MQEPQSSVPHLSRVLNSFEVMLLAFSALSPAASVFIGAAGVLHLAGSGAAIAFVAGGVIAAVIALLYAELGAAFPRAGGPYPSVTGILGPWAGFPYVAILMLAAPFFMGFAALGLADYLRVLVPALPSVPIMVVSLVLASAIAILDVRRGAFVTGLFLAVESAALLILAGVAVLHPVRPLGEVLMHPVFLDGGVLTAVPAALLGLAVISGAWACAGASWAMYFGEEMKDASRRIGRVIGWVGALASLTIAGPVVLVLLSARDLPGVLGAEAPFAAYLSEASGPVTAAIVSIGVVAAIFNNLIAASMGLSRFIYATGRDRLWPSLVNRILAHLHPRLKTPITATVLLCAGSALIGLLGEQIMLIVLSGEDVFNTLLISLAVLSGRWRGLTGAFFRAPIHPLIPLFGLFLTAAFIWTDWLDADAGRPSVLLLAGVFLGGLVYYRLRLRWTAPDLSPAVSAVTLTPESGD